MEAQNNIEAVQFESNRSNRGQFGVGVNLPLIAFSSPKKGWTFSSKLGEICRGFDTSKSGGKSGGTICEETIISEVYHRGMEEFVDACHAGSCEFESRPPRTIKPLLI